jgi:hypothetical protein
LLGLVACGDSGNNSTRDPAASGTTTSASTTGEPSPTEPTSTVKPASGFKVDTSRFSFRAPKGFENHPISGELIGSVVDLLPDDSIYFSIFEDYHDLTLDEMAKAYLDASSYQILPKEVAHTEIDGRPVFHLSGPISDRSYADAYGLVIDGTGVNITFEVHSNAARRKEIIESTLATFRWK